MSRFSSAEVLYVDLTVDPLFRVTAHYEPSSSALGVLLTVHAITLSLDELRERLEPAEGRRPLKVSVDGLPSASCLDVVADPEQHVVSIGHALRAIHDVIDTLLGNACQAQRSS